MTQQNQQNQHPSSITLWVLAICAPVLIMILFTGLVLSVRTQFSRLREFDLKIAEVLSEHIRDSDIYYNDLYDEIEDGTRDTSTVVFAAYGEGGAYTNTSSPPSPPECGCEGDSWVCRGESFVSRTHDVVYCRPAESPSPVDLETVVAQWCDQQRAKR